MKTSKFYLPAFFAVLFVLFSFVKKDEPITVNVQFELLPETKFNKGTLVITETAEKFEIAEIKNFSFPLKKGKYHFKFQSDTPFRITYPSKITTKEHTIKITLGETAPVMEEYATEKNWQQLLQENKLKFIHFGFAPVDGRQFLEKYGIAVKNEGCVITPTISNAAKTNNKIVAKYLDSKFGGEWKKDLNLLLLALNKP